MSGKVLMPVIFRDRDLVNDWSGWWIAEREATLVWTEEVMLDVRLEKKALPEDGAEDLLVVDE